MNIIFYKKKPQDKVWWVDFPEEKGTFAISFDKENIYYLYRDYFNLSPEQRALFNKENPYWEKYFGG